MDWCGSIKIKTPEIRVPIFAWYSYHYRYLVVTDKGKQSLITPAFVVTGKVTSKQRKLVNLTTNEVSSLATALGKPSLRRSKVIKRSLITKENNGCNDLFCRSKSLGLLVYLSYNYY